MAEPFFDLPDCPDAAGLVVPDALPTTPILADCSVPEPPEPACDCPPPRIAPPPTGGSTLFHVRVTARSGLAHAWEAVESDGSGGWAAEGRSGAIGSGAEAYEQSGAKVRPGPAVYLARRSPGGPRLVFTAPRVPFFVRLSGSGPAYAWTRVARDGSGGWTATADAGAPADGDGAREVNDEPIPAADDPDRVYEAQRDENGEVVVDASSAAAPPGPSRIVGTAVGLITARSGTTPGTGSVQPCRRTDSTLSTVGPPAAVYNAGGEIHDGKWCSTWVDDYGDRWVEPEECN